MPLGSENNTFMTLQILYTPISVEDRTPEKGYYYFVITKFPSGHKSQKLVAFTGKWILSSPEIVTHWLEKQERYVLSKEELEDIIKKTWDAASKELLSNISATFLNPANQAKAFSYADQTVFQGIGETITNFPIPSSDKFIKSQL